MSDDRPDRTTMPGMIWNANHVLDAALDPNTNGVPVSLFQSAVGILLMSTVEVGFIFSGNVGSGILLAKKEGGGWSAPCAVGLTGVGWGFLAGGAIRDIMVFIFDRDTLNTLSGEAGLKFGGQIGLSVGPFGRDAAADINLSNRGAGATASVAFSKGAFAGLSIEGALVGPRNAVNQEYYSIPAVAPRQILFEEGVVAVPEGTLVPEIYKKLDLLAAGKTTTPDEAEKSKVASAKVEAEKAGEEARKADDVEHVDVSKKAAEEGAAPMEE